MFDRSWSPTAARSRSGSSARCARSASGSVAVYSDADAGARTCARPTRPSARPGAAPTSHRADPRRGRRQRREASTPATASCPRTRPRPRPAPQRGSCSSARRRRHRDDGRQDQRQARPSPRPACPWCPAGRAGMSDEQLAAAARWTRSGSRSCSSRRPGGGGKGMRLVATAADLLNAIAAPGGRPSGRSATTPCSSSGFVERPRHIEVQVFADTHGHGRAPGRAGVQPAAPAPEDHRGAPSPLLDETTRDAMGAAVAAARSVRVRRRGHGRVHRLGGPARRVLLHGDEHPPPGRAPGHRAGDWARPGRVAAAGGRRRAAPVGRSGGGTRPPGHAIEARVYAEDPGRGFLPASGTVRWKSRGIGQYDQLRLGSRAAHRLAGRDGDTWALTRCGTPSTGPGRPRPGPAR
jgi:acetyl-CoA/propionyl-CoA carboxylase biotin carboxyl carrier protein